MVISIADVENKLKQILGNSDIQSYETVYEKDNDLYKLVIDIKNIHLKNINLFYTKLIFYTDNNKAYLKEKDNGKHYLKYLYDINCKYKEIEFSDINEMEKSIMNVFTKSSFGNDITILSNFIKSPSTLLNSWLYENDVRNISAYDITLDDRYKILPCKDLYFIFNINLNNQMNVRLTLTKESDNNYIYDFKIYNDTITEERSNLLSIIQVIGETLKTKYL